ncbi:MAG TPA: hypothetical protein VGN82_21275 [Bosea sp. (in: a-proteobacteria)]|jgi:uncharacterized protein with von Willebrand factor type A (vWA) domain|uniref:hypothetical protein n=1 Tax=Bosea sp. (in: a-proteobacteria) TaxID=1871050 RepID=UPI002E148122|nr:hypothetical protein [Bosea sp. (in: a-proteobacteria)]
MKVVIADTHCYAGCPVTLSEDGAAGALVEFSDGVTVLGDLDLHGDEAVLTVPAYATARRSRIETKTWRLRRDEGDASWRIKARVQGA